MGMIIAATGDVHSPRHFNEFVIAMENLKTKPDLFLISGDMIDRGEIKEYERINNVLFGKVFCPIVACFGNNEWQQYREELKQKYREIRFLDDQSIILKVGTKSVGIFGSTGSLDTPTPWQRANIPNIENIYRQRYDMIDRSLQRLMVDFKILLTHYAPTFKTLEGENPRFFTSMGSQVYENILVTRKPNLAIHGHSHRGIRMAWVDTVPVFNVSLPANREIVVIDTEKDLRPGIAKFV
jgi:Icc-related predicted phosphoesterase